MNDNWELRFLDGIRARLEVLSQILAKPGPLNPTDHGTVDVFARIALSDIQYFLKTKE